jgi:serine/threonine protein kinase
VSLKKLGRYDLLRVLGKGAMGIVYEGRDPNLDRRVAIKTVKVENMSEEAAAEYEARFRTEARSAARLQHPNIVSVYDSDRDGDIAFLVMEFIQGDDLKAHIDKGERYTLDQSLKMIRDLLAALDYAHKQGIVHRDIKPANLLIEPGGRIKLTDFGVARIQDSGEATRTQGAMVGTLKYMSPEQVQGQPVDSRADLFAVGIVLYQLLTSKRPFDGENDFSIIHQIIGHEPTPPSTFNPQLPAELDAVVSRALAKKRDERFATARDFAVALQAAVRRASDQTVVPPASTGRQDGGVDTRGSGVTMGSATSGTATVSATMTNTSTVTQELELVYWKDIKDSVEPEEIEGFLLKFPTGIYADLARRRLKKLASGAGETTTGSFGTGTSISSQDTDATRMRDFTRPMTAENANLPGGATSPGAGDYTRTMIEPRVDGAALARTADSALQSGAQPAAASAGVQAAAQLAAQIAAQTLVQSPAPDTAMDSRDAPTLPPVPGPPRQETSHAQGAAAKVKSSTVKFALIGVAAVALAGVILKMTLGGGAVPVAPIAGGAAPSVVAPAVVAPAVVAPAVVAPAVVAPAVLAPAVLAPAAGAHSVNTPPVNTSGLAASATVAATSSATAVVAAGSKPAASLSAGASAAHLSASQLAARAKPKASAAATATLTYTPTKPAEPPSARIEARTAPASPPVQAAAASPKAACEDRVLIGFQICMAEQCARPVFQNHPLCVERREMERRSREAQQRN